MKIISFFGAVLAFLGVGLGAFGVHGLKETLLTNGTVEVWKTAVFYHLIHAVTLWVLGMRSNLPTSDLTKTGYFWLAGVGFFSGSLYLLALGSPKWLGPVTPLGGFCFLLGWGFAAKACLVSNDAKPHD